MIRKEWLIKIKEINMKESIDLMREERLAEYVQSLHVFVDDFPLMSNEIQHNLDSMSYLALADNINTIRERLIKIYADELAEECPEYIETLRAPSTLAPVDHDRIESFVEDMIHRVSTMLIEIKMATHRSEVSASIERSHSDDSDKRIVILSVDDSVVFSNILHSFLKNAPYELHCMSSCAEALEYLAVNKPNVILLDIDMPDMDGFDLAQRIKATGSRAPFIYITAHYTEDYIEKAIGMGAAAILMKPLNPKLLLAKLEEVI
jgi:CheY-like chemotaxis protein